MPSLRSFCANKQGQKAAETANEKCEVFQVDAYSQDTISKESQERRWRHHTDKEEAYV